MTQQQSSKDIENIDNQLVNKKSNYQHLVEDIISDAKKLGADEVAVRLSAGLGLSTNVRMGKIETLEHNQDQSLSLTIYKNKQKASVHGSDLSKDGINNLVSKVCSLVNFTQADPCGGLIESKYLAKDFPDLDCYHPWAVSVEESVKLAKETEQAALDYDSKIKNSEGGALSSYQGMSVLGSSNGFLKTRFSSRHSLSCSVIAQESDMMQRDYDYSVKRCADDLLNPSEIGKLAASKAVKKLNARKVKTQNTPVIFQADVATGLISSFLSAISGSAIYRNASFLEGKLEHKLFPDFINIYDDPFVLRGLASSPYDSEGAEVCASYLIQEGVLNQFLLGSYSARKLNMEPNGHSGGSHNIIVSDIKEQLAFDNLLKKMGTGFLVTDVIGQGVDLVTGNYSRGANGFWVENGEIKYPVEEVTIAGNLKDMFLNIINIGSDIDQHGSTSCGSILIEKMMLAGS